MSLPVLIVDDSQTVRMDLVDLFDRAGMASVTCGTVAEAREALERERFSLVLLDVLLPDGDGIQLLEEIRANPATAQTAVMMLSTESEVRHRVRGLVTGADEYVGKPYDEAFLVARARELVRRGEVGSPSADKTVLVIDDSITFREELRAALEAESYRVLVAGSGEEGLRILAELRPSAAIVDGVLPGMDGPSVIRSIRLDAALRRLPCFLLTASEDRGAEVRALDAGADAFVRKDEDIPVIIAKFNAMVRSAGAHVATESMASLQSAKRILAVDDSETYLQGVAEALRDDGYNVMLARSGEEALELLAVESVDCILLDVIMPGLGGLEACRRVKSAPALRDIPIVLLTAVEDRAAMIDGLSAGADDYVAKSSEFDLLRARLLAQLRRKQFEDESRLMREQLIRAELESSEAKLAQKLSAARAELVDELEEKNAELDAKNAELDAFSYSVAHDLRTPLRGLDGFSLALLEDYGDKLDDAGRQYLTFIRESAQHMATLIDDLLGLSRVTRSELRREKVDLAQIARAVFSRLETAQPERKVQISVPHALPANGDAALLAIVMDNLIGNAWKYSGKREEARIEVGSEMRDGRQVIFVRDNGAGFDMAYAAKLFGVFQRLHTAKEFEGTGIGLATVHRIIRRHGGSVWAEGKVDHGSTFYFSLSNARESAVKGEAA